MQREKTPSGPRAASTPVHAEHPSATPEAGPAAQAAPAFGRALQPGDIRRLQGAIGNSGVARRLAQRTPAAEADEGICPVCGRRGRGTCSGCGRRFVPLQRLAASHTLQRDDTPPDPAVAAAQGVYDALDGWNNERKALQALSVPDKSARDRIPDAFVRLPANSSQQSIQAYLKDQLGGDTLVRAMALLTSGNTVEAHTAVALALFGPGTRDDELARVIEGLPLSGRKEMETRYNAAFASIGDGSLRKDLKDDLSGWRLQKMLVQLDRDLTDADHLYFNTVAITGTHSDSAVRIVQDAWKGGPQKFGELDAQWEKHVRNQANGDDAAWTTMTLEQALKDEMDMEGEAWGFVKAVLDGYHAFRAGNFAPGADGAMTDEQLEALETIQLNTAWATLDAAASGAGTNETQMQNAAADIRRIWNRRIEWATRQNRQDKLAEYRQNWEHEQQQLRARIDDEMDADGDENLRARLLMQGDLTIADEVYLAKQAVDYDQVRALVTRAWGAGKIGELQQKSREERTDAGGVVVRPRFDTTLLVPVTSGADWSRVYELVRDGATDAARGAARLKLELDQGDDESDLKRAYDLVTAAQATDLRAGVVTTYAQANLADTPGETPVKKFLNAISTRYKQSYSCYQFMDLLDPAATPQQMLERAEGRKKASNSGVMNAVLNYYVAQYDTVTGEDSQQVVDESIERLRFIVQHSGARQDELAAMMAMTGETTPEGLAKREYGDFVKRLEELRALKRAVADAIAQVVELAVDALITVLTGGAGAAMLVASLGAAIAGMVARELMLGQDYDLLSKENAQQLAMIAAGYGFGAMGRTTLHSVVSPERLQQLGRAGAFLEGAVAAGVSQAGTQTLATAMSGKMPTAESIAASAASILAGAGAGGASGAISHGVNTKMPMIGQLRMTVGANIASEMITGMTDEGTALLTGGVGDLSGPEIATRFGKRGARALGTGVVGGLKDAGAMHTQARKEGQQDGEQEGEQEGKNNLQGREHEPSGAGHTVVDPAAARSKKPGVVAVRRIHPEHTISIFRGEDGKIIIKICSDCAPLYAMLSAIRAELGPQKMPQSVYDDYHGRIRELEQRLNRNPDDHQALMDFEELGGSLESLTRGARGEWDRPAGSTAVPASGPAFDTLLSGPAFTDPQLQSLYTAYCERKRREGQQPLGPEQWARVTSGAALDRLNGLLGAGWRDRARASREPRGEVSIEMTPELRAKLPPYPHPEYVGDFPIADGQRLTLQPSQGRDLTGQAIWREFLQSGVESMPPHLRGEFERALQQSRRSGTAVLIDGSRGLYWPTDGSGAPWELHHRLPLELGGADIPANWVPLPPRVHTDVHAWWQQLKNRVLADQGGAMQSGQQGEYHEGAD